MVKQIKIEAGVGPDSKSRKFPVRKKGKKLRPKSRKIEAKKSNMTGAPMLPSLQSKEG